MTETENEYGCTRCQAWHGESDGLVYAEHIMWQSKHGLRSRPVPVLLDPEPVPDDPPKGTGQ